MTRLLAALLVALLLATSLAEAQRGGWGRGYGRWGGEAGVPPRFPTEDEQDGGFHFCRLMYTAVRAQQRGMGWGTDYPYADINFSIRLSEMTKTVVSKHGREPNHIVVRPTDEWLSMCPFVMASDPASAGFSPEDARGLRDYLLKGGFLWVDDYWGPYAWEDFSREIAKVLPPGQYPIKDLTPGASDLPRACSRWPRFRRCRPGSTGAGRGGDTSEMGALSARAHMAAISDPHGRVMVLMTHNTDIADSWEREGEEPEYFYAFSPNGYALGMNVAVYAMTH